MSIDDYAGGRGRGAASLLARDLGAELHLLARNGATTAKVLAEQLPRITRSPDLVTITMTNDAPIVLTTVYDPSDGTGTTDPDGPAPT